MNYKDPDNIFLIVCGAMGIGLIALVFRYLFIGLGFDSFGANLVFVIVFVVCLILFISYLEFLISRFSKTNQENEPVLEENIIPEQVETFIEESKSDLDIIREKHQQKELLYKERLLETALEYTRETFAPYATDENINLICKHVTDYYNGFGFDDIEFAIVHDLSTYDLYHYGWNIWNHFKPILRNKQEEIACFLKAVFAKSLRDIEIETIRKKLTFDEGKFKIELNNSLSLK